MSDFGDCRASGSSGGGDGHGGGKVKKMGEEAERFGCSRKKGLWWLRETSQKVNSVSFVVFSSAVIEEGAMLLREVSLRNGHTRSKDEATCTVTCEPGV